MANWGADFWGAYADVARAHAAKQLFEQQMAGRKAFGQALQDPNIFLPGAPQGVGAGNPQGGGQAPGDMSREMNAISSIESGGRYNAIGNPTRTGDRAYGKYQVMGANVPTWTAAAGQRETPQQFLADTNMQDKVFKQQFGANEQKYGPAGAASMWFTGRPNAPGARDVNGTTGNQYVQRFTQLMGQTPQNVAQTASAIGGAPPGQLSWQHIVQAIVAKNPNIDPGVLSQAVELFQPIMSQQSQLDWREQSLQLREMAMQNQMAMNQVRADQGQQRIDVSKAKEADVQSRFDATQDRLYKGLQQRSDEFKTKLAAAKTKADRDYYLRQSKANADQRHQRAIELIQRGSSMQGQPMTSEDQQKALADEEQRYQAEQAQLDAAYAQSQSSGDDTAKQPAQRGGGQMDIKPGSVYSPSAGTTRYSDADTLRKDITSGKVKAGSLAPSDNGWAMFKGGDPKDRNNWVPVKLQE